MAVRSRAFNQTALNLTGMASTVHMAARARAEPSAEGVRDGTDRGRAGGFDDAMWLHFHPPGQPPLDLSAVVWRLDPDGLAVFFLEDLEVNPKWFTTSDS